MGLDTRPECEGCAARAFSLVRCDYEKARGDDHETRIRRLERFFLYLSPIVSAGAAFLGSYLKP